MSNRAKVILLLTLVVAIFHACKHEPIAPPPLAPSGPRVISLEPCDPDSSYFYNDVVPILINNCAFSGCHSAVSLSNYSDIINIGDVEAGDTTNSYLYTVITTSNQNKRMPPPPRPPLPDSSKAVIAKWILQGARANACNDCDPTRFEFNAHVLPVIVKNCEGCHSGTNPSGGIRLTNYFQIKEQADNGKLLGSLKHQSGFSSMPPSGKMPDCQISIIESWINNGAPND